MREYRFTGTADASGAFAWEDGFWVLDDESHILRHYQPQIGTDPTAELVFHEGEEADWEACALDGNDLWVCGSLGRDKKARRRTEREVFGRITLPPGSGKAELIYSLLDSLTAAVEHRELALNKASLSAVKTTEGLNVEGMAVHPNGGLAIGLRGPLHQGKAIILQLRNPTETVQGHPPMWGTPILLGLGGLGVRGLENSPHGIIITAGPSLSGGARTVWLWENGQNPVHILSAEEGWNLEGLVWTQRPEPGLWVISDDGAFIKAGSGGSKKKGNAAPLSFRARFYPEEEIAKGKA